MDGPIEISIAAVPSDQTRWSEIARRCESIGARALLLPDHPGSAASPFVALAAAAAVTSTLRLSTYVSNAGVRHPLLLASDVATLDIVSDGRAELGIGAGHTPAEFEMTGRQRPDPAQRVRELTTVASAVRALLDGRAAESERVGALRDLRLDAPRPVQTRIPILVGGGNHALLDWAGANADAVGLSGLGRTLPDGHMHRVRWSFAQTDAQFARVRTAAADADRPSPPQTEALVQVVRETDDRDGVIDEVAAQVEAPPDDVRHAPYALIGTIDQITDQLFEARERWGLCRWAVRADALDSAERILARLHR